MLGASTKRIQRLCPSKTSINIIKLLHKCLITAQLLASSIQEYRTVKTNIGLDLKKTGKCDFTIAKELFFSFAAGLAVAKNMDTTLYSRGQVIF